LLGGFIRFFVFRPSLLSFSFFPGFLIWNLLVRYDVARVVFFFPFHSLLWDSAHPHAFSGIHSVIQEFCWDHRAFLSLLFFRHLVLALDESAVLGRLDPPFFPSFVLIILLLPPLNFSSSQDPTFSEVASMQANPFFSQTPFGLYPALLLCSTASLSLGLSFREALSHSRHLSFSSSSIF